MNFRSKNGGNYCDNCYTEKFQPKCSKCAKVIGLNVKYSKYKNKCYHPECFACSKCKKSIQGIKEEEGNCPHLEEIMPVMPIKRYGDSKELTVKVAYDFDLAIIADIGDIA
nr:unnamed protein product [Spirometra erinaceieuropaei]